MRHGLLLTAVATVTVPGLVAVFGAVGHGHVTAGAGVAASAAPDSTALSGPFPVGPATIRAEVRDNVVPLPQASGAPVSVLSRVATSQQAMGMTLLDRAADASLATTYQGTERISQSGVDGQVTLTSTVWHQGGGSPAGVFGVTKSLVALLGQHYVAVYGGSGTAVGRPTAIVELYRFDGSLAARYWLDRQTMVPLRRQLFDTSDNVISDDSFVQVTFGALTGSQAAGPNAVANAAAQQPAAQAAWVAVGSPARFLTALTAAGWQVPASLPGGLPLYAAASTTVASGEVVDLEYTDGLYVASLFVQRGKLAADMSGWQPVRISGQQAYVSGHSVSWAGPGLVYTLIADAPPQTVTQVVESLGGSGPPGLLSRLERGLRRLARLVNPFG